VPLTRILAATAVAALALALPAAAMGTTITVTTTADAAAVDGLCSLREAVTAANLDVATSAAGECAAGAPGADRIVLGPGLYRRTIGGTGEQGNAVGDLDVSGDLEIAGAGATTTIIDAAGLDRVIDVLPGRTVRIADVTITGGATAAGTMGPSVVAPDGSVDAVSGGPGGDGESGAGLRSAGTLTIERSRVVGSVAGAGGRGGDGTGAPGPPGRAGGGGAGGDGGTGGIETTGALTLLQTVVSGNRGGAGGTGGTGTGGVANSPAEGGPGAGGPGGTGGTGGVLAAGAVTIRDSAILDNQAGPGGPGGDGVGGAARSGGGGANGGSGSGGSGGDGGLGGGGVVAGAATIERTTIASNATGPGGRGGNGRGGNQAGAGLRGAGVGGAGGAGGAGGGLAVAAGSLALVNATVAGNITAGGGGGGGGGFGEVAGGAGGPAGPGGSGGGLAVTAGSAALAHVTLSANGAGGPGAVGAVGPAGANGAPGAAGAPGSPGAGATGGLAHDAPVSLNASILAGNACSGAHAVADGGANLAHLAAGCAGAPGDPRLGPLAANGGPAPTLALGAGSAAIDRVPAGSACPATDGRGAVRPVGAGCDAGAFEVAPPAVTTGSATLSGRTARIEGTVSTRGLATSVWIEIGMTTAYGTQTPVVALPGDAAPSAVVAGVGGLAPLTTYHYRLVATGPDGTVVGADRTLSTPRTTTTAAGPPRVRAFGVSPRAFAPVPPKGTIAAARRGRPALGTIVTFRLSERATVRISIQRILPGRRANARKSARCLPVAAGVAVARARRCTVTRSLGTVERRGASGLNRFVLTGRVGTRVLAPGSYRLVLVATDADGRRSSPVRATITVLRAG
jgi:CSLREA domain-containing protein